jgi:TRAP-type C4-dicarboxylate transport system permease small subunit
MEALSAWTRRISSYLNIIAGIALTGMMVMTVIDVGLRAGGHPIVGTYEIVSLALAIVIGFAIPRSSLDGAHVYMEIGLDKLGPYGQNVMRTVTRFFCAFLFVYIGYNLFSLGAEFHASGEVSQTLKFPFYPVAYGAGACCFLESWVFVMEIINMWRGNNG